MKLPRMTSIGVSCSSRKKNVQKGRGESGPRSLLSINQEAPNAETKAALTAMDFNALAVHTGDPK